MFHQAPTSSDSSSAAHPTISRAISRATEQIELFNDPDTTSAWAGVLRGLEVVIEYDERLDKLENDLWFREIIAPPPPGSSKFSKRRPSG